MNPTDRVTENDLSSLFGITVHNVRFLVRQKVLIRTGDNYELGPSVLQYVEHLRSKVDSAEIVSNRERLTAAQADLAELELAKSTGNWIPVDEVRAMWGQALAAFRQGVLGLPSKLMQSHPHLTPDVFDAATREARQLLSDLSTADIGQHGTKSKKLGKRGRGRPRKSAGKRP